jgi:hypothetical protein
MLRDTRSFVLKRHPSQLRSTLYAIVIGSSERGSFTKETAQLTLRPEAAYRLSAVRKPKWAAAGADSIKKASRFLSR